MTDKKSRNWGARARKAFAKKAQRRQSIKDYYAGGPRNGGRSMLQTAAQFRISEGRVWQIVRDYVKG